MEARIERVTPEDASDLIEIQNLGFREDFNKESAPPMKSLLKTWSA